MGLDMYIYGIEDISNENIPENLDEKWYDDRGYNYCILYDEEDEALYRDLYDYSLIRNVVYTETDWEKFKKHHHLSEDAQLWRVSSNNTYSFTWGNNLENNKEFQISELKKYDIKVVRKTLIFRKKELAYWRKEYDLQDLIYNNYDGEIYNCGYHYLNDEIMKKINNYLKKRHIDKQDLNNSDYPIKMYHEWY